MKPVTVKLVPKLLNFDQENRRMSFAQELLTPVDLLEKVITGEETLVYCYVVQTGGPEEPEGGKKNTKVKEFPNYFLRLHWRDASSKSSGQ